MRIREKEGSAAKIYATTTSDRCMGGSESDNIPITKQMERRIISLEEENRYLQEQLGLYKRDARGKFSARHHVALHIIN